MLSNRVLLAALAACLPACLAQTSTTCNPMEKSCDADTALKSDSFSSTWTSSSSLDGWTTTAGSLDFGDNGAEFTINKAGDAPTIQSDFYIFFGKVEVTMQAAPGTGIVSSIVLLSDTLDEIDWEFTGGDTTQTQTNYFGKGNTTTYDRAIWYPVSSPQTSSHTYTVDWTSKATTWSIDGTVVRTLEYADANGGENYPQTPMRIRLGNWAGGAPGNPEGTIEWSGGETDFSQAPFSMYVQSVKITNYSPGSQYVFTDRTGSYESIEVENGSGSGGHSAASGSSTSASASATTTEAAGTTVEVSSTAPASSVRGSTVRSGAQLSTIPLQVSSSVGPSASRSADSSTSGASGSSATGSSTLSTATSGSSIVSATTSAIGGESASATSPGAASASQDGSSDATAAGGRANAFVSLGVFVAAALVTL